MSIEEKEVEAHEIALAAYLDTFLKCLSDGEFAQIRDGFTGTHSALVSVNECQVLIKVTYEFTGDKAAIMMALQGAKNMRVGNLTGN